MRQIEIPAVGGALQAIWDAYNEDDNEDLELIDAIIAQGQARCAVGDVQIWGHSQGGFLAFSAGLARGESVDGVMVSAATESIPGWPWRERRPLPYFIQIGELDSNAGAAQESAQRLEQADYPVHFELLEGVGHRGYAGQALNPAIWEFLNSH